MRSSYNGGMRCFCALANWETSGMPYGMAGKNRLQMAQVRQVAETNGKAKKSKPKSQAEMEAAATEGGFINDQSGEATKKAREERRKRYGNKILQELGD